MFPKYLTKHIIHFFFAVILLPAILFATTYYSQGSDNFGTLSNWNSDPAGAGSSPTSINATDDFVIQNGHTITNDGVYVINSLTIESGGTYNGNGYTITLNGNFTQDGTLTDYVRGAADFKFSGSLTQTISGLSTIEFDTLTFNGTGSYTIQSEIYTQRIILSSGSLNAGSVNIHILGVGTVFDKTGGTFNDSTSTFIFSTSSIGTQTISSNDNLTFYNLTHSPGASRSLTFAGDVQFTVSNTFTRDASSLTVLLDGTTTLNLNGATLVYSPSSSVTVSAEWPTSSLLAPDKVQLISGVTVTANPGAGVTLTTNYLELNNASAVLSIASGSVQVNTQTTITAGSISLSGGAFAWGTGTTTLLYNGSAQQTVGPEWSATIAPTNVQINNSSTTTPALNLDSTGLAPLTGNFILTLGSVDYALSGLSLTVSGDVVGGSGSFGTVNSNTLNVNGATSAITSSGQAALYNLNVTSSAATISDITISGTLTIDPGAGNTTTLTGPLTLDTGANLTVASGTLNLNGQSITKNGTNALTLAASTQLITGGSAFEGFTTYSLDASSTILLNGTATEDIPTGISYGNIQINKSAGSALATGTGTITLQDNADLTLTAGTFDLAGLSLAFGNYSDLIIQGGTADLNGGTLTITATNTNALSVAAGATLYTGGTSLDGFDTYTTDGNFIFDGSVSETIPAGMTSFNNLTINNGAGVSTAADIAVNGTLTLALGTFTPTTTVTINGTLTTNGGNFSTSAGTAAFAGSAAQTINGTSAVSFYNFTINNTNGVTLAHNITVDGVLTLTAGVINTGGYLLSMGTGASFSGGSSTTYVDGAVAKTFALGSSANFTFQTAKNGQYLPVGVTFTDVSGSDYTVTVEQFNSDPHAISTSIDNTTLSAISTVHYWEIQGSGGTPANLQVTLTWGSGDGIEVPSALDVAIFDGTNWTSIGGDGVGDATGGTIQSAVFTTAGSYFTFGDDANNGQDNSLPVTLASFKAEASYDQVVLTWKTESEVDNLGFNIYRRSEKDQSWQKINSALIAGAGNSSMAHEYQFIDQNVVAGETYSYRLESVNFNGGVETFDQKIQSVQIPVPTEFAVFPNYPNPFNPETTLRFQLPEQERISILIYDLKGNLIKHLVDNELMQPGEHRIKWNATNDAQNTVSSGTYVYRLVSKKHTKMGKMVFIK